MFTFPIHATINHITATYKGILLDAYGVFWGGNGYGIFPGSKEAMETLVSSGKTVGILSNSTQLAAKEIEKLKTHGLQKDVHFHFMITSGEIARKLFMYATLPFETPKKSYVLCGRSHPRFSSHLALFEGSPYKEVVNAADADFIYISIPHLNGEDQVDPSLFKSDVLKVIESGLPVVCPNPDRFAHEGNPPRAVVRQGTIAQLCEEAGASVFYIGKPSTIAYEEAMQNFGQYGLINPSEILMVGDTPETDIRGARAIGMATALVTKTGIMADRIMHHGFDKAIQALPKTDFPDFFIERFICKLSKVMARTKKVARPPRPASN